MSGHEGKKSSKAANAIPETLDSSDSDNELMQEIECKPCSKSFVSVNAYKQHIHGKRHYNQIAKKRVSVTDAIKKLVADHSGTDDDDEEAKYTELTCDVCSKTFSGYKPYVAHIHGSIHARHLKNKALKEKMKDITGVESNDEDSDDDGLPKVVAKCKLCEKDFTGLDSFRKHLVGSLHKKKLQQEKIMKTIKDEHKGSDGEIGDDFYKKCEVCDKEFSGLQPYQVHMKSLVHKKALKRAAMSNKIKDLCTKESTDKKFICKECEHTFADPFAFQLHLDNNTHKKYETKAQIAGIVNAHPEIVALKTIQSNPDDEDSQDEYGIGDYVLVCKLCHNSFSGPQSALDHVKSKKHAKTKQERETLKKLRQNQKTDKVKDGNQTKIKSGNGVLKDSFAQMLNGASKHAEDEDDDFEHVF